MASEWDEFKRASEWEEFKPATDKVAEQRGFLETRGPMGIVEDWRSGKNIKDLMNLLPGAVRGASRIGSTLLASPEELRARLGGAQDPRAAGVEGALTSLGADKDSPGFMTGDIMTQVLGTLGVGGAISQGVKAVAPQVAQKVGPLLSAVETAGTSAGGLSGAAGVGTRIAGGSITGGAAAGLVDPRQAKTGAMIGGAMPAAMWAGGKGGELVGQGARSLFGKAEPEVAALAKRAKELGIDIPADRLVQSKPLDAVASGLNYVPFSGRAATESRMVTQLNQALSKTFGQSDSNVTAALRRADDVLGGQFDDFLRGNKVAVDQQLMSDLAEASNMAARELGKDGAAIIANQVDDILAKAATGEIDGQAAYNIKRTLDRIGRRNSPEAWYALDLKQKLMDALNRSVGQTSAKGFSELRKQYGNMLELQKLAKNGVEGEISVARLANLKNIRNQDLQELADIAAQFVKPREGQHGAMQRAVVGLGTASTAGLPGLVGGATLGRATNSLLNSNALRGGLLGESLPPAGLLANELQQYLLRATPVVSSGR